jgi:hypothetical protein
MLTIASVLIGRFGDEIDPVGHRAEIIWRGVLLQPDGIGLLHPFDGFENFQQSSLHDARDWFLVLCHEVSSKREERRSTAAKTPILLTKAGAGKKNGPAISTA